MQEKLYEIIPYCKDDNKESPRLYLDCVKVSSLISVSSLEQVMKDKKELLARQKKHMSAQMLQAESSKDLIVNILIGRSSISTEDGIKQFLLPPEINDTCIVICPDNLEKYKTATMDVKDGQKFNFDDFQMQISALKTDTLKLRFETNIASTEAGLAETAIGGFIYALKKKKEVLNESISQSRWRRAVTLVVVRNYLKRLKVILYERHPEWGRWDGSEDLEDAGVHFPSVDQKQDLDASIDEEKSINEPTADVIEQFKINNNLPSESPTNDVIMSPALSTTKDRCVDSTSSKSKVVPTAALKRGNTVSAITSPTAQSSKSSKLTKYATINNHGDVASVLVSDVTNNDASNNPMAKKIRRVGGGVLIVNKSSIIAHGGESSVESSTNSTQSSSLAQAVLQASQNVINNTKFNESPHSIKREVEELQKSYDEVKSSFDVLLLHKKDADDKVLKMMRYRQKLFRVMIQMKADYDSGKEQVLMLESKLTVEEQLNQENLIKMSQTDETIRSLEQKNVDLTEEILLITTRSTSYEESMRALQQEVEQLMKDKVAVQQQHRLHTGSYIGDFTNSTSTTITNTSVSIENTDTSSNVSTKASLMNKLKIRRISSRSLDAIASIQKQDERHLPVLTDTTSTQSSPVESNYNASSDPLTMDGFKFPAIKPLADKYSRFDILSQELQWDES